MEVAERIRAAGNELTAAERRVAEVILARPHAVGFGTVADLASASGAGAATVVRLAGKLGFDGYTDLQSSRATRSVEPVAPGGRSDPRRDRRRNDGAPPGDRARQRAGDARRSRQRRARRSGGPRSAISRPVVVVLSGNASDGVARQFAADLAQLRPAVTRLAGNEVAVRRDVSLLPQSTTVVVIDVRRYDSWVLDTVATARQRGMWIGGAHRQLPLADRGQRRPYVRALGRVGRVRSTATSARSRS